MAKKKKSNKSFQNKWIATIAILLILFVIFLAIKPSYVKAPTQITDNNSAITTAPKTLTDSTSKSAIKEFANDFEKEDIKNPNEIYLGNFKNSTKYKLFEDYVLEFPKDWEYRDFGNYDGIRFYKIGADPFDDCSGNIYIVAKSRNEELGKYCSYTPGSRCPTKIEQNPYVQGVIKGKMNVITNGDTGGSCTKKVKEFYWKKDGQWYSIKLYGENGTAISTISDQLFDQILKSLKPMN